MAGRLIVLEGCDGSGKSTQLSILERNLRAQGLAPHTLSYPVYASDSSALVRMYLSGAFGSDPGAVNPYMASSFYAVDRCADYLANWKRDYDGGALFISGRYTTSNAVHQGAKLEGQARTTYTDWLFDYEYRLLGLPKPDLVLFLDIPVELALANIEKRGEKKDIHETRAYIEKSRESALCAAARYDWTVLDCAENGRMRMPEQIGSDILRLIRERNLC